LSCALYPWISLKRRIFHRAICSSVVLEFGRSFSPERHFLRGYRYDDPRSSLVWFSLEHVNNLRKVCSASVPKSTFKNQIKTCSPENPDPERNLWLKPTLIDAIFEHFKMKTKLKFKINGKLGHLDLSNQTVRRPPQSRETIPLIAYEMLINDYYSSQQNSNLATSKVPRLMITLFPTKV
jgi:hypothetical protein